jgi:hypothetical protein
MESPDPVLELTGRESGVWKVKTRRSEYLFDFEKGTVTRIPGADAGSTINDGTRPLRRIEICLVGERGRWTMLADDFHVDYYYWQVSSAVSRIEKVNPASEEAAGESR